MASDDRTIADIDSRIADLENLRSLYPRTHGEHILCVYTIAGERWVRYGLSRDTQDLDKCIIHNTEAILLSPVSLAENSRNVLSLLYNLAIQLRKRFEEFEQPDDIKYSIEYLRYLRGLALDSVGAPRIVFTTSLILALGCQSKKWEAGVATRNIKEMLVLCRELLTSNLSAHFLVAAVQSLKEVIYNERHQGRADTQLVDQVVEYVRDAAKICTPDSHTVFYVLADILYTRFIITHSIVDYEEAMPLLDKILDPNQPEECPDRIRDQASELAAGFATTISTIFQNPQYSEDAISRLRTYLSSPSVGERSRQIFTGALATKTKERFTRYDLTESLEEANSSTSQLTDLSPSGSQEFLSMDTRLKTATKAYSVTGLAEKIQQFEGLLSTIPPGTDRHYACLHHLAVWYESKFDYTNNLSDIEESVKYYRLSLDATHPGTLHRVHTLDCLSGILELKFEKTREISYLDESIAIGYDALESAREGQLYVCFRAALRLVQTLIHRNDLVGGGEDLQEVAKLSALVINDQYASDPDRFQLSCQWTVAARLIGHPTTLTAYKTAMLLIQKSLSFAPTVSIQHTRLVEMGEFFLSIPRDYASYQIGLGQFEEAVETLEKGRALLWSELRSFRASIAGAFEESTSAERLAEVNQELEALTISVTPSGRPEMEDGIAQGRNLIDPFGRLVVKRQKLLEERDALVSQIQGIPGSEGLWKAPSFITLRSAASHGPVIIINHCKWRSDILIIFHNSLPCSIPTAKNFYARANKLQDELAEARKHGLDSGEYQDALCSVLKGLYDLVGEPVIKRLRILGVPEQSRIWWCPTSVFCSLPLHAMGPIPSRNTGKHYFSDLYIPSYTPSLSSLIESRKASPHTPDKPSLLLVSQPDDNLPGVRGEIEVIRRALKGQVTVTGLVSSEATPSSVVEGLLGTHFAHFACHGVLEAGKPFEASFKLHGGSRLKLLDMVQFRLPDAEFAFLSCCHSAEITEKSIADEGLHLTAAMQYCGFRSVVGTMWEMADTDGRDLAKSFYKSIFSSRETGVPYYERSARALRDATQKLRGKRGINLERWVNFVHYGA